MHDTVGDFRVFVCDCLCEKVQLFKWSVCGIYVMVTEKLGIYNVSNELIRNIIRKETEFLKMLFLKINHHFVCRFSQLT